MKELHDMIEKLKKMGASDGKGRLKRKNEIII